MDVLRQAQVLSGSPTAQLSWDGAGPGAPGPEGRFREGLADLQALDVALHEQRTQEIVFAANVLVAGSSFRGRAFRPVEAAQAAVATCDLGLETLLGQPGLTAPVDVLARHGADLLFRLGWRILYHDISLAALRGRRPRTLGRGNPDRQKRHPGGQALDRPTGAGRPGSLAGHSPAHGPGSHAG
jgi:hypothetical protein